MLDELSEDESISQATMLLNVPSIVEQATIHRATIEDFMNKVFDHWSNGCVFCNVLGTSHHLETVKPHKTFQCQSWITSHDFSQIKLYGEKDPWCRKIRMKPGTCCYSCAAPQSFCDPQTRRERNNTCTHGKTLWYAAFALTHSSKDRQLMTEWPTNIRENAQTFWTSLSTIAQWEGQRAHRLIVFLHRCAIARGLFNSYQQTGDVV